MVHFRRPCLMILEHNFPFQVLSVMYVVGIKMLGVRYVLLFPKNLIFCVAGSVGALVMDSGDDICLKRVFHPSSPADGAGGGTLPCPSRRRDPGHIIPCQEAQIPAPPWKMHFEFDRAEGAFEFKEDEATLENGVLNLVFRAVPSSCRVFKFPPHFSMMGNDAEVEWTLPGVEHHNGDGGCGEAREVGRGCE